MQAQHVQPAGLERIGDAAEVAERGLLRRQMPESVDHVEAGIDRLLELEVGHVADVGGVLQAVLPKPSIAEGNRLLVEIES